MKWTIKGKYETAEKLPFSFLVSDENWAVVAEKTLLEMSQDRKDLGFCDYIQRVLHMVVHWFVCTVRA